MADKKSSDTGIGDVIKKVVSIGVGAAFMTEDAVRNILSDLPLPKDILSGLVQNAKNAKEDFALSIREELSGHLAKLDHNKIIDEILRKYDFEVKATISFKKKETPPT
ncbi:MAG: hypothetical protein HYV97_07045 [Bdellovibrio sp.]|nr:hypothetical protein [Bdellovibrio sp.]